MIIKYFVRVCIVYVNWLTKNVDIMLHLMETILIKYESIR